MIDGRTEKRVDDSRTVMTEMIMPNDTNPLNNLMGGNLMRWMDVAGGICAGRHAGQHVVTASVDHVSFSSAIKVGDVITIQAQLTRAWGTSMEVYMEVFAADARGRDHRKANHAYMTFVALDEKTMKPTSVPSLIPLTSQEEELYKSAARRREIRLILSGRLQASEAKEVKEFFSAMK